MFSIYDYTEFPLVKVLLMNDSKCSRLFYANTTMDKLYEDQKGLILNLI